MAINGTRSESTFKILFPTKPLTLNTQHSALIIDRFPLQRKVSLHKVGRQAGVNRRTPSTSPILISSTNSLLALMMPCSCDRLARYAPGNGLRPVVVLHLYNISVKPVRHCSYKGNPWRNGWRRRKWTISLRAGFYRRPGRPLRRQSVRVSMSPANTASGHRK